MNGGRYNPWTDAHGVPIAKAARVKQIGVDRPHGALLRRQGKLGVVTAHRSTRVAVQFDGEEQLATLHPYLLGVVEQPGSKTVALTDGQADGFHWHVYSQFTKAPMVVQTPAHREVRLAARPEVVLSSPVEVAERVVPRSAHGGRWLVWRPVDGRWQVHIGRRDELYREVVALSLQHQSIYLATERPTDGYRVEVYAEGVNLDDCPAEGRHDDNGQTGET